MRPHESTALITLLGKPIEEARALFVPTAICGIPHGGDIVRRVICGTLGDPFCDLPWRSLGLLELTALSTVVPALWLKALQDADPLLVGGGRLPVSKVSGVAARPPM
jgi:dipeptidase E